MAVEPFSIAGREVSPGARRTIQLQLTESLLDRPMALTVRVIHGRRPGPTLVITAAIHGDELLGVEIARRLAMRKYPGLAGTLVIVPVVNLHGFIANQRYLPDRRDLNRCFPGREQGSLASRMAHLLMSEVIDGADLVLDLHTGSGQRANLPQLRADFDDPRLLELARAFAPPLAIHARLRDGSLRQAAADRGVGVLVFEAGEALRVEEPLARLGVGGALRLMRQLKMIRGPVQPREELFLARRTRWLRAPRSGLFTPTFMPGRELQRGEVLGRVESLLGEETLEIVAPSHGVVMGWTLLPTVREGDALLNLALLRDAEGELSEVTSGDFWEELDE